MARRWLGIDFSGDARMWSARCARSNVWVAVVVGGRAGHRLESVRRVQQLPGEGSPFERLARLLRDGDFEAAGIDAPFSLPLAVCGGQSHASLRARVSALPRSGARPFADATRLVEAFLPERAPRGAKLYRATEEHWRARGLNLRSTLWAGPRGGAAMTVACMTLLHAAASLWPWSAARRGVLAEAFPAGQLRHWGLPHERYTQDDRVARARRRQILRALDDRLEIPAAFRVALARHADALDAVLCALAAIGVSARALESEPPERAQLEGWIAVRR